MKYVILGILTFALTASMATPGETQQPKIVYAPEASETAAKKEKKPKLEAKARPRTQFMKPSDPYKEVRVDITIKDANEEWWCAGLAIFWGDGSSSNITQSCVEFEYADEADIRRTRIQRTYKYRYPGHYTITIFIGKEEDVFAKKEVKIQIRQ